jgi:BolA family transcriptional regulator, general stress-responsive regulator
MPGSKTIAKAKKATGKIQSLGRGCRPIRIDRRATETISATMRVRDTITKKLKDAFTPESIDVVDESHLHQGHAGHRPGGESHFRVYIVAAAFAGKSRIDRHRMINAILSDDLQGGIHALAIHAAAPGEQR